LSKNVTIVLVVFAALSVAVYVLRIVTWRKRTGKIYIDFATIARFDDGSMFLWLTTGSTVELLAGTYSFFLVWIMIVASLWWLIFYKV
jgi:hypothetical protein